MRHPYNRIVKWVCHADKHIFTYWTIKPSSTLEAVEEAQRAFDEEKEERGDFDSVMAFDVRPYCDCVYLVHTIIFLEGINMNEINSRPLYIHIRLALRCAS